MNPEQNVNLGHKKKRWQRGVCLKGARLWGWLSVAYSLVRMISGFLSMAFCAAGNTRPLKSSWLQWRRISCDDSCCPTQTIPLSVANQTVSSGDLHIQVFSMGTACAEGLAQQLLEARYGTGKSKQACGWHQRCVWRVIVVFERLSSVEVTMMCLMSKCGFHSPSSV